MCRNSKEYTESNDWNVGANISFQTGNIVGADVSAGMAKFNEDGTQETYTNTHINDTDTVHIQSGDDVTLTGASVTAKRIDVNIGAALTIISLQDMNIQVF